MIFRTAYFEKQHLNHYFENYTESTTHVSGRILIVVQYIFFRRLLHNIFKVYLICGAVTVFKENWIDLDVKQMEPRIDLRRTVSEHILDIFSTCLSVTFSLVRIRC